MSSRLFISRFNSPQSQIYSGLIKSRSRGILSSHSKRSIYSTSIQRFYSTHPDKKDKDSNNNKEQESLSDSNTSSDSSIPPKSDSINSNIPHHEDVEKTTGVIETEARQGLVYYDHIYPSIARFPLVRRLLPFTYFGNKVKLAQHIKNISFPDNLPLEIVNLVPRERDGGAFVTYEIKSSDLTLKQVEQAIYDKLEATNYRPWFSPFSPTRGFSVKGTPWIEDLRRYTSNKIKVTFEGPDLSQETLYSLLRRYGPIVDIIPPAPGTKDLPRSASVIFTNFINASTARNCITGLKVQDSTIVHLSFEALDHKNIIKDWVVNHPRLVIPIIVALLAALTVIIFEPIRIWTIEYRIRHGLSSSSQVFDDFSFWKYIRRKFVTTWNSLSHYIGVNSIRLFGAGKNDNKSSDDVSATSHLWDDRIKSIDTLKQWIQEGAGTFIVISGPRGGGKEELVLQHALKNRDNVLMIDCENLARVRGDSTFVKAASREIGYYPVFPWKNSIANYLDVISQGLTGQKTGFSESTESQFKNMLASATTALQRIALRDRDCEADETPTGGETDENYLQLHPEKKPVIVINHFMGRYEMSNQQFIYKLLAEWAAQVTEANIAHIIFITSDVGHNKILSEALPNQVFKNLVVGDATAESARSFVLRQISEREDGDGTITTTTTTMPANGTDEKNHQQQRQQEIGFKELDEALAPLGGRLTDLQAFSRRVKSGDTPAGALKDMVEQSAVEILQMFLMKQTSEWTSEQAWVLVKKLAKLSPDPTDELSFGDIIQDPNFKTREQQMTLSILERNEMILTTTVGGRILTVRPGKPLYHAAFQALVNDSSLYAQMESQVLNSAITKEEANITKYENELETLSRVTNNWETRSRINYLTTKLYASQKKIEDAEKKLESYKKAVIVGGKLWSKNNSYFNV